MTHRTTHDTILALLGDLANARDAGNEAQGTSPSHLAALLKEAAARTDLPEDKRLRWVGFARGVMAARGFGVHDDVRVTDGVHLDDPVSSATRTLMGDLHLMLVEAGDAGEEAHATSPSRLAAVLEEALTARKGTLRELSLLLGFVQGVMTVRGMITVNGERDRTRPYFHAAYAAQGREKPPTVGVGECAGGGR